jgi:hypothetical protein
MGIRDFRLVEDAVVRVFTRSTEPGSDDASDVYVLEVFGVSILVRLRTTTTHPANRPQLLRPHRQRMSRKHGPCRRSRNGGESHYRI